MNGFFENNISLLFFIIGCISGLIGILIEYIKWKDI